MKLSVLPAVGAAALAVKTLGLDEEAVDLLSLEVLCASLRRAASFLCPATPRQLVDAVLEASHPLSANDAPTRDEVMEHLDLLIASGDLLELSAIADQLAAETRRCAHQKTTEPANRPAGGVAVTGDRMEGVSEEQLLALSDERDAQLQPAAGRRVPAEVAEAALANADAIRGRHGHHPGRWRRASRRGAQ